MNHLGSNNSLKMERNLLERMFQERNEKIASLRKCMEVQNEHVNQLQAKTEVRERREKQVEQRHKLKLANLNHANNMLKSQLQVVHNEIQRIGNDPAILKALISDAARYTQAQAQAQAQAEEIFAEIIPAGSGNAFTDETKTQGGTNEDINNVKQQQEKIKLTNNAQGLLLQSQLYQALNSIKQLRQQAGRMKDNYDEIVLSLQQDLVLATDSAARNEVNLRSQLTVLERDKRIMQKTLEEVMIQKGTRIMRLEKRIRSLDKIDDAESGSFKESAKRLDMPTPYSARGDYSIIRDEEEEGGE